MEETYRTYVRMSRDVDQTSETAGIDPIDRRGNPLAALEVAGELPVGDRRVVEDHLLLVAVFSRCSNTKSPNASRATVDPRNVSTASCNEYGTRGTSLAS